MLGATNNDTMKEQDLSFLVAKPIADLFPHCTVLFADISGFSAWSSERAPEQIFTLFETIFQTFDKIARRRSVFKVETIGDSYVAVTGLPDQQMDHAVRMARFARDCMTKVNSLTKMLEASLGPDTGELKMRFGLHSQWPSDSRGASGRKSRAFNCLATPSTLHPGWEVRGSRIGFNFPTRQPN
jgi:class 3 adenylate cyclase